MSNSACAGKGVLGESLVRLPRILPYCSRRVTVAFAYGPCSVISLETHDFPFMFVR